MTKFRIAVTDESPPTVGPYLNRLRRRGVDFTVLAGSTDTETTIEADVTADEMPRGRVSVDVVE